MSTEINPQNREMPLTAIVRFIYNNLIIDNLDELDDILEILDNNISSLENEDERSETRFSQEKEIINAVCKALEEHPIELSTFNHFFSKLKRGTRMAIGAEIISITSLPEETRGSNSQNLFSFFDLLEFDEKICAHVIYNNQIIQMLDYIRQQQERNNDLQHGDEQDQNSGNQRRI